MCGRLFIRDDPIQLAYFKRNRVPLIIEASGKMRYRTTLFLHLVDDLSIAQPFGSCQYAT